jgi:hypothetical protein
MCVRLNDLPIMSEKEYMKDNLKLMEFVSARVFVLSFGELAIVVLTL